MYEENRTVQSFAFIDRTGSRTKATLQFASLFRCIYNHPDWSQLFTFFTKRYTKRDVLSDRDARRLHAPEDALYKRNKKATVNFKTDPSSVGLPRDLVDQLAEAGGTARGGFLGPDPQPCAIGPAISVAVGAGAYMDLLYDGKAPGDYPWRNGFGKAESGGKFQTTQQLLATTKQGGRNRSWEEWAQLWAAIAEWVYEHDATACHLLFITSHSYKYRLSDEDNRAVGIGQKIPRQYLSTRAIDAADAVRDVFRHLAEKPSRFQGIEWDFLELDVRAEVRDAFYRRFGRGDPDASKNVDNLGRNVAVSGWNRLNYNEVSPMALKQCPESVRGVDWETWYLSIEGGDVAVVKTIFQVSGPPPCVRLLGSSYLLTIGFRIT